MRARNNSGLTLVEVMIIVVIMSVLAAVAVPTMIRYTKRARTSEAFANVARIYAAQLSYRDESHGHGLSQNFVSAPATPNTPPRSAKYAADLSRWTSSPAWVALGFGLDSGHYFQYASPASATSFEVRALGDFDNDGVFATYSRTGQLIEGEISASNIAITLDLE